LRSAHPPSLLGQPRPSRQGSAYATLPIATEQAITSKTA
jgi:hypothetical protein